MNSKANSSPTRPPAQTKKRTTVFDFGKYLNRDDLRRTVKAVPLPLSDPIPPPTPAAVAPSPPPPTQPTYDYEEYEEVVKEVMVLENQAFGANFQKLCTLFLIVFIMGIIGVTAIVMAIGKHSSHGGSVVHEGVNAVDSGAAFIVSEGGDAVTARISTYYYSIVLNSAVQQWQSYPRDGALPALNSTIHEILSYDICCFAEKPAAWLCSNGNVLVDMYSFEAKLQDVKSTQGAVQCLVYLNSKHLSGSACTLEVKVRT